MSFKVGRLYWCHEEPISLSIVTIAKNNGYYPVLGIKGFLEYSRRELLEANIHLPLNLVQGKGTIDVVFTDTQYFVIGASATITYAFIEYMGYPAKTKYHYSNIVFGSPTVILESYKELKDLKFKIPAYVVGKLYKSTLFVTKYNRTRRLLQNKDIILWAIIPFYAGYELIAHIQTSINDLKEHLINEHQLNIKGIGVIYFNPRSMGPNSPGDIIFKCIGTCILGKKLYLNDFRRVLGDYKSCTMCRYVDICKLFHRHSS